MLVFIIIIFAAINVILRVNRTVGQFTGQNLWETFRDEANAREHDQMHQQFQQDMDMQMQQQMQHDMHMQDLFQQQMQHDMEMGRMAATGMEFGGFNPDPNMNPGMSSGMDIGMF